MKQIPIKNINLLNKLDSFATILLKMPHSFEALPKADLTFKKLKEHMADGTFVGYPKSHNYQDYSGKVVPIKYRDMGRKPINLYTEHKGAVRKRLRTEKYFFLEAWRKGMAENFQRNDQWYFDTVTVMPPRWGHTGWHNSKNKPRCYIRFIYNGGSGYSIEVEGKQQTTVKDQRRTVGAGNWTCISGHMGADGKTWFADCNTGSKPRVVIDVSIPEEYQNDVDGAIEFIQHF